MTEKIVTIVQLREWCETDASDSALQRMIDDADESLVARYGEHQGDADGVLAEELYGGGPYLFPSRRVESVTSITEYGTEPFVAVDAGVALDATDYQIMHGGRALLRLVTGTNPFDYWGWRVVVEYVPVSQMARRRRIALDLCKLTLTYKGMIKTEQAGDYRSSGVMTPQAYQEERERLLSELSPKVAFV